MVWRVTHWDSAGQESYLNLHTVVFGMLHKLLPEWGNIFKEWVMAYIYFIHFGTESNVINITALNDCITKYKINS